MATGAALLAILAIGLKRLASLVVAGVRRSIGLEARAISRRGGSWSRSGWWRSRWWHWAVSDDDVGATVPHLICLLAVPSPTQYKIAWRVWNLHLVHDAELVATSNKEALSELVEASLEHGAMWAVARRGAVLRIRCALWVCAGSTVAFTKLLRLATASQADVTSAAWNWVGAPLGAIFGNVCLGWNLDVRMRVVVKMNGGILTDKLQCVALEARLSDRGRLRAQAVTVPSAVLSAQSPTNLGCSAGLPGGCGLLRKHLGTLVTTTVALGNLDIAARIAKAAGHAARILHWCLARSTPRVVLCEITTLRLAMRIPRAELWVIVCRLHQALTFGAMRCRVEVLASQGARWATNVATNLIPVASIADTTVITAAACMGCRGAVGIAGLWVRHGTVSHGPNNQTGCNGELHRAGGECLSLNESP